MRKMISGWSHLKENKWHSIIEDGWAGASNPPPTPILTPHTQTCTKSIQTLVILLFDSTITDERTDGRTNKVSYGVACLQLKTDSFLTVNFKKCIIPAQKWHNFQKLSQIESGKLYFSPMFQKVKLHNLTFFQLITQLNTKLWLYNESLWRHIEIKTHCKGIVH